MLKEFKNVTVNYEGDALIKINDKLYKIPGCIEGEDILVETEGKYPKLSKILKPSEHRIKSGCPHQNECGGCQFMHMDYNYELEQTILSPISFGETPMFSAIIFSSLLRDFKILSAIFCISLCLLTIPPSLFIKGW